MVLILDDIIIAYMVWKAFVEPIGNKLTDYAQQQYLRELEDALRNARALYERKRISEETYKKLEAELTAKIESVRAQMIARPATADIRL